MEIAKTLEDYSQLLATQNIIIAMLFKIDQHINANLWERPYILREMVTKLGYPTLGHFTHNNVPILGRTLPKVLHISLFQTKLRNAAPKLL